MVTNMKIILISGKAMHGKDHAALMIKKKLEQKGNKILTTHFADLLKFICTYYFNWDGEKDEKGRTLLQWVGTDIIRNIKPNYWVDFVKGVLSMFKNEWDYVLIPDCRFQNEMHWDKSWNITTVRVERLNFESPLTKKQQEHISETALDNFKFDYYIKAESGLDKLEIEINKFIKWLEEFDV